MSGQLSAEQLRKFRGYAGRAFTLDELRGLFDHIDALTAELANESRWREQDALRLAALAAENDALHRRHAAAEAGIAAEIARARAAYGLPEYISGLEIAARIVTTPEGTP